MNCVKHQANRLYIVLDSWFWFWFWSFGRSDLWFLF